MRRESRHEVIETLRRKYVGATRTEKGVLIAQAVELTGYDAQYARRLLHRGAPTKRLGSRRPGRSRVYKHTVMDVILVAAEATCVRRLKVGSCTHLMMRALASLRAAASGATIGW